MVLYNRAPSVPQTPCKASTPEPENFSAGFSTPRGSTMATSAQRSIRALWIIHRPGRSVDGNPGQPIRANSLEKNRKETTAAEFVKKNLFF